MFLIFVIWSVGEGGETNSPLEQPLIDLTMRQLKTVLFFKVSVIFCLKLFFFASLTCIVLVMSGAFVL